MNVKKIILLLVLILFTAANVEASGLNYDTLATTATKKNPASLSLIKKKNDGSLFLTAVDTEKNLVSLIPFNRKYYRERAVKATCFSCGDETAQKISCQQKY